MKAQTADKYSEGLRECCKLPQRGLTADFYSGAFWVSQKACGKKDYEDFLSQNTNSSMYNKKCNIAIMIVMASFELKSVKITSKS